jgi:NitT/TauT family transport system ATP-binding protein
MTPHPLIVGFIPLLDCAPLVAALEKGFAAEEGIELTLVRETLWANIRDRLIVGHCQAATCSVP